MTRLASLFWSGVLFCVSIPPSRPHSVTVVTALFCPVTSEDQPRAECESRVWFENLAHVSCPLIVFTYPDETANLVSLRQNGPLQVIEVDEHRPIWLDASTEFEHAKVDLLYRAVSISSFDSDYFLWVDADIDREGYFRSRVWPQDLSGLARLNGSFLVCDPFGSVPGFGTEKQQMHDLAVRAHRGGSGVGMGVFGGSREAVARVHAAHQMMLESFAQYSQDAVPAGEVMAALVLAESDLFSVFAPSRASHLPGDLGVIELLSRPWNLSTGLHVIFPVDGLVITTETEVGVPPHRANKIVLLGFDDPLVANADVRVHLSVDGRQVVGASLVEDGTQGEAARCRVSVAGSSLRHDGDVCVYSVYVPPLALGPHVILARVLWKGVEVERAQALVEVERVAGEAAGGSWEALEGGHHGWLHAHYRSVAARLFDLNRHSDGAPLEGSAACEPLEASGGEEEEESGGAGAGLEVTVMNLRHRTDRRRHMERLLAQLGVRGAAFPRTAYKDELDMAGLAAAGVVDGAGQAGIAAVHGERQVGAITANAVEHLKAIRAAYERGASLHAVLEDDLQLATGAGEARGRLAAALAELPAEADMLYLEACCQHCAALRYRHPSPALVQLAAPFSAAAVVLTRKGMERVLGACLPLFSGIDDMYQQLVAAGRLQAFAVRPPLFFQDSFFGQDRLNSSADAQRLSTDGGRGDGRGRVHGNGFGMCDDAVVDAHYVAAVRVSTALLLGREHQQRGGGSGRERLVERGLRGLRAERRRWLAQEERGVVLMAPQRPLELAGEGEVGCWTEAAGREGVGDFRVRVGTVWGAGGAGGGAVAVLVVPEESACWAALRSSSSSVCEIKLHAAPASPAAAPSELFRFLRVCADEEEEDDCGLDEQDAHGVQPAPSVAATAPAAPAGDSGGAGQAGSGRAEGQRQHPAERLVAIQTDPLHPPPLTLAPLPVLLIGVAAGVAYHVTLEIEGAGVQERVLVLDSDGDSTATLGFEVPPLPAGSYLLQASVFDLLPGLSADDSFLAARTFAFDVVTHRPEPSASASA